MSVGCPDPGVSHHWYVRATNAAGSSPWFGPIGQNCDGSTGPLRPAEVEAHSPAVGTVIVSWTDTSPDETGFEIGRGGIDQRPADLAIVGRVGPNVTSFTITGCTDPGVSHHWYVRALGRNVSDWVGPVGQNCDGSNNPLPPANLKASSPRRGVVVLTWRDISPDEIGFEIGRGGIGQGPRGVARARSNEASFIVGDCTDPGVSHHWYVRALYANPNRVSAWVGPVGQNCDGSSEFPAPTNLVAMSPVVGTVVVTWTDTSSTETMFEIGRGGLGNTPPNLIPMGTVPADTTTFIWTGCPDRGVSHHWYVRAVNGSVVSAWVGPIGRNCDGSNPPRSGIFVTDVVAAQIVRIDPQSGAQEAVSSGGLLRRPYGIVALPSGPMLVADAEAGLINIDLRLPAGQQQSIVSSGGLLRQPMGLALEAGGTVVVTDSNRVIRIDPTRWSGNQTLVSTGGSFSTPHAVVVEPSGTILVANQGGGQSMLRVDPRTGSQTVVPGSKTCANGMTIDAGGNVFVAGSGGCGQHGIFRFTPAGARSALPSGGNLATPYGMAVDGSGVLLVADPSGSGSVVRVNPQTGAQTVVSSGGLLVEPIGIAVVAGSPGVPEPPPPPPPPPVFEPLGLAVQMNAVTLPSEGPDYTVESTTNGLVDYRIYCGMGDTGRTYGNCETRFYRNTVVDLTASPSDRFVGWEHVHGRTGPFCQPGTAANVCRIHLTHATTVRANFRLKYGVDPRP